MASGQGSHMERRGAVTCTSDLPPYQNWHLRKILHYKSDGQVDLMSGY